MKINKKLIEELVKHLAEFNLTDLEYEEGQARIKIFKCSSFLYNHLIKLHATYVFPIPVASDIKPRLSPVL